MKRRKQMTARAQNMVLLLHCIPLAALITAAVMLCYDTPDIVYKVVGLVEVRATRLVKSMGGQHPLNDPGRKCQQVAHKGETHARESHADGGGGRVAV